MKTETPTPRTDAATTGKAYGIPGNTVSATFARQLETELAESHERNLNLISERDRAYRKIEDTEAQLVTINKFEWCDECGSPLCRCGPQGTDGIPTTDCLVCKLRAELAQLRAERQQAEDIVIAVVERQIANENELKQLRTCSLVVIAENDKLKAQLEGMVNGQKQDQQHIEQLERERDEWRELCERFVPAVLPHHNAEDPVLGCAGCEALADYEQLKGHK